MDRRGTARLLVGSLFLLLAAAGGAALHGYDRPTAFDSWVFQRLTISPGNALANAVTWLGSAEAVIVAMAVGVATTFRRDPNRAIAFLVGPALAGALVEYVGKPLVDRRLYGGPCFPSGHAAGVTCIVVIALLAAPRGRRLATTAVGAPAMLAVSVAVVGLGWHFPTDVLGGFGVGAGVMLSVDGFLARAAPRRRPQ